MHNIKDYTTIHNTEAVSLILTEAVSLILSKAMNLQQIQEFPIQLHVIKFIIYLQQVGGVFWVHHFLSPIKFTVTI